ncbi:ABC transporter permease [Spirosoma sp. BT702]|uniref:ABC transporter permease n=2 Tax=Spirosoma profusum TaxID=2771354 RepID=A0A927AP84_9BACT|nr:ABC transporter permease [Spirosoma profusum]
MLRNYLFIAWRNSTRNKLYFLINHAGLAIGMTACIFMVEYANFELSYDTFNQQAGDLYRVVNDRYQDGKRVQHSPMTYSAVGQAMRHEFPEVINHTRVAPLASRILIADDQKMGKQNGMAVDPSFFGMFSYQLIAGNRDLVLREPDEIILSESCARKLFPDVGSNVASLIGRLVNLERSAVPYKLTGICYDVPDNSHLQFDFLVAYSSLYRGGNRYWKSADSSFTESYFYHYIQLKPGSDPKRLEAQLPGFSQRYFRGNKVTGSTEKFSLQPLLKAHLYSDFGAEIGKTGNATIVWGALLSALLILSIAWINYINLATARAVERAKEVGIRKSSGATRTQLVFQFFSESLLSNFLSMLLAAGLIYFVQARFNELVQRNLSIHYVFGEGLQSNSVTFGLLLIILSGICIAGFYPALVLSSFKPVDVLKGKFSTSSRGVILRKALVSGQFAVTIALVAGSIIIYQQMRYAAQKPLGLTLSQVLVISPPQLLENDSSFITRSRSFKEELKNLVHVKAATNSGRIPGEDLHRMFDVHRPDKLSSPRFAVNNMSIGEDFLDLYDIKLLAGRNFRSTDYNEDLSKVRTTLLNESAAKLFGFPTASEAVGKSIILYERPYEIVGVTHDFHQKSIHHPVEPVVMMPNYSLYNPISVKVEPNELTTTLAAIRQVYDRFFPGNVFAYRFLDDQFNEQYNADRVVGKVFALFAGLAVLIAALGLLGLSWLATRQRTREIGVRKVLGASVQNIVLLLSGDFLGLILIAFLVAVPVAWFVMQRWLTGFAYRISINAWVFVAAGGLALLIALITIGYQTLKAANANPVKSLRSE